MSAQYDYLLPSATVQRSRLQVSTSNCPPNSVFVTIVAEGADGARGFGSGLVLRSGNETLIADLQVAPRSGSLTREPRSRGEDSNGLSASATGEMSRDDLVLTIQPGQRVLPGRYSARVRVSASSDPSDMAVTNAGAPLEVMVEVLPMVGLAAGSGTSLELGDIRPGGSAVRPVTFQAYSNTPYEIQLLSDNDWKLLRKGSVSGAIEYAPEMNGLGTAHSGQFQPSSATYHRHDLNVRVSDFERAGAGIYSDWVTIRIRPLTGG
ncbi:hypothetical protein [Brevundimonas intermedia]|uniref:hypothetical protein n=1 Tax=Brevundimonas intermedia TaxID=74315 RepID=UPI00320BAA18